MFEFVSSYNIILFSLRQIDAGQRAGTLVPALFCAVYCASTFAMYAIKSRTLLL